jgi:hypothetical protein
MQTKVLGNVLEHLQSSFAFDKEETRKLLVMLHKTLTEARPDLLSNESERIYYKSHKLHSELHICGCEGLADIATEIEAQSKKGIVEQALIEDFLARSSAFGKEIQEWLSEK